MAKSNEVKVLTFGEKSFAVDTLSPDIQALVEHYNGIGVKEAELRTELFTIAFAKKQIEREIEVAYVREQQEKEKEKQLQSTAEQGGTPTSEGDTVPEQDLPPANE